MTCLHPLLNYKEDSIRFFWWFALFLGHQCVMNLHCVKNIHQLDWVETRPLIKTVEKHLFNYAVEAEITQNTVHVHISAVTET